MSKTERYRKISDNAEKSANSELTKLSFKYVDWNKKSFFLHGGTSEYYEQLISCFQRLLETQVGDWCAGGPMGKYIKPINWNHDTITQRRFEPRGAPAEMLLHCFEVRLSRNHGRLHGFLHAGVFSIVWFDPCHNLFPGTDDGKGKKLAKQEYRDIPGVNTEVLNLLSQELEKTKEELVLYKQTYDPTSPT